jgi:integrase
MLNKQELKPGLVIFQRSDVKHKDWHCRMKVPDQDRYKLFSLNTTDVNAARTEAFKQETRMHIKIEEGMPIFNKPFADVAKEYSDFQKQRAGAHEITHKRWSVEDGYISKQLNPYCGNDQVTLIGEDKWKSYPLWRRSNGEGRGIDKRVSDWTIRAEMATLRSIMLFAAAKKYVADGVTKNFNTRLLKLGKPRGEAFTPEEYKRLYTHARGKWLKKGKGLKKATDKQSRWYREMFSNFMLVMTNTGLRPPEARNLLRRDLSEPRTGKDGRSFVPIRVRGKDKYRELVAPMTVNTYLARILEVADQRLKELGKTPSPDTHVFINYDGEPAESLYASLLEDVLSEGETNLLLSAAGKRRSTYSFRHTYATFRLLNGTDVYWLAKQMGTSVQMIEDYYGHITPVSNADRILQGLPGWEPVADVSGEVSDGVNAGGAGKKAAKPRTKK